MLDNFVSPYDATVVTSLRRPARSCSARRTWTSSRWAHRTRRATSGPCAIPGIRQWCQAAPRADLLLQLRRGSRQRHSHGHGRLHPPARGAVRCDGAQAHVRSCLPVRNDCVRVESRPGRCALGQCRGCCARAGRDGWVRSERLHERGSSSAGLRRHVECAAEGPAHRTAEGVLRQGSGCGEREAHSRGARCVREAGCGAQGSELAEPAAVRAHVLRGGAGGVLLGQRLVEAARRRSRPSSRISRSCSAA